ASRYGLSYLGEAVVVANNEADLAPEGAETIRTLAGGDRLKQETYIDIFSGRSFREALLVHAGRAGALAPAPPPQALQSLHFLPALDLELAEDAASPDAFRLGVKETEIILRGTGAAPAMRRLIARRPGSSRLADLVGTGDEEGEAGEVLRIAVEAGL